MTDETNDDNSKEEEKFIDPESGEVVEEETKDLMENHDIDKDTAEQVQELIDEGIDEDDAVEIQELI
jgi:hypothetical protein